MEIFKSPIKSSALQLRRLVYKENILFKGLHESTFQ